MPIDIDLRQVIDSYRNHPEFLGVDILDVNQKGAMDDTLLHMAARMGRVQHLEVLVRSGADVNVAGDLGNTALHQAAMSGQMGAVRFLLDHGATASIKNEFLQTPSDVAMIAGHSNIGEMLSKAAISRFSR